MNSLNVINDDERYKVGNRITWITISINIILAIGKLTVGIIANSTAMIADGIHTVSDVASSVGIVIGFFISKKPEDKEHQYGHEKAESIAGFILSLLLIAVGIKIGYDALLIIISGQGSSPGILAAWAAGISIFVKELQYRITIYGGRKINSNALIADAWHHRSDSLSSIGALGGIIGARMGYEFLDPLAGLVVSIIVVKVGIDLFIQGYNELMDSSVEENILQELVKNINKETDIININEIRARKHGPKVFVDIKACVEPDISVAKGHDIAEDVEDVVYHNLLQTKDVLVHINPCIASGSRDCSNCQKQGAGNSGQGSANKG